MLELVQNKTWTSGFECQEPSRINMSEVYLDSLHCLDPVALEPTLRDPLLPVYIVVPSFAMLCIAITGFCLWQTRKRRNPLRNRMVRNGYYYRRCIIGDSSERQVPVRDEWKYTDKTAAEEVGFTDKAMRGKVRLGKLIGRGAFGEVYEAYTSVDNKDWTKVAVKKIKEGASVEETDQLLKEYKQLVEIWKHPNIIQVYGSGCIQGSRILVLELAEEGDLLKYLRQLEVACRREIQTLDSAEQGTYLIKKHPKLFMFMWHIAKGMEYISRMKIVHRDLAARNVLIAKGSVAKISDFGLSRDIYESGYYFQESNGRLPFKWMSPETLSDGRYSTQSDVWSYGVVLWETVTLGSSPYPGIPPDMLLSMYKTGYIMPQPPFCSNDMYTLMEQCWSHNPKNRPSFSDIVEYTDHIVQTSANHDYVSVVGSESKDINHAGTD